MSEISEEMVEQAFRIASGARTVGAGDGDTYIVEPPTRQSIRAALAAVAPLIRAEALEEAAKRVEADGVNSCEIGQTDPETGTFECRKLDNGECFCWEVDEIAAAIRAMKEKV